MQQHEWLIERQQLLERIKELEAENTELRKKLGEDVTPTEKKPTAMQNLSLQEKVDLFRSLFKGREDAQPVSLTLPLQAEAFVSPVLFPFFDGLIPEGWLLSRSLRVRLVFLHHWHLRGVGGHSYADSTTLWNVIKLKPLSQIATVVLFFVKYLPMTAIATTNITDIWHFC